MTTAVLCDRGQITIPKPFRSRLGFAPRMVLSFRISGNALVVEKPEKRNPFEEARGCCKFPEGVSLIEYTLFAQTIDDRFTCACVSCHPDITDTTCACKWRFVLKEDVQ